MCTWASIIHLDITNVNASTNVDPHLFFRIDLRDLDRTLNLKGSALETLEKLKKIKLKNGKRFTPFILFTINGRKDIDTRSKLPIFGEWMNDTIKLEFQEKNPKRAYQLLTKVSNLLEIAYAGCYDFDCVIPVTTIQSEYQTLMYKAVRVRYVNTLPSRRKKKAEILHRSQPFHRFLVFSEDQWTILDRK